MKMYNDMLMRILKNKTGSELLVVSNDLEDSMYQVFELLDKIKIENCSNASSKAKTKSY